MRSKSKKPKQYKLGSGGLPKSLADHLYDFPEYFDPTKHPLLPYLDRQIIPEPGLDILLLQNFEDYCYKLELYPHQHPLGLYIAELGYGMRSEGFDNLALDIVRKDYGITTARAVLFPDDRIEYGVLIHELLHDAFNNLQDASRKKLLDSAKADFTKLRQLCIFSPFLLSTSGLSTRNDLYNTDEFIAHLFYGMICFSLWGCSRSEYSFLPERFGKTLRDIGYKV